MKFKTLERDGRNLRLIDQTQLPGKLVYRNLDDYRQIIEAIKRLEVRGAPAIGIAAAYGLAVAFEELLRQPQPPQTELSFEQVEPFVDHIVNVGDEFKASRPTAVNLFWAIDRVIAKLIAERPETPQAICDLLWSEAEAIHDEDRRMCQRIGEHGATLINNGDTILTHCNAGALATGGIGTALAIIYTCHDQGKRVKVYADETRPLLQGARLTAWELQQEGIDVTLICDSMAAFLMKQGKIDHIIVGADRIAANGDTANKIGTYSLAVLAKAHDVPFYVAAPSSTFDNNIASGDDIVIEERAPGEITEGFGIRTAPDGIDVYSPAFDITPNELITTFITDEGVKTMQSRDTARKKRTDSE